MSPADFETWLRLPPGRRRTLVMGVLNVTPDSFSDGGRFVGVDAAAAHAVEMATAGVDVIDVGGESTRPGSQPVSEAEQIARVVPVLRTVAGATEIACSVDTTRAAVAAAAIEAGAAIVNDVSAGRDDADLLPLVAKTGVPVVLMHMLGTPATMQIDPRYEDVSAEVGRFLADRAAVAESAGIAPHRTLLDPGLGFGKTLAHNLQLLHDLRQLTSLGRPVLVGASRKGFIGTVTGIPNAADRVHGSVATAAWAAARGAGIVRVHDVGPTVQAVKMIGAILRGGADPEPDPPERSPS